MSGLSIRLRYGLVASVCMITHNVVMIAGDGIGLAWPLAVAISFGIVVLIGFVLHSRYTFSVGGDVRALFRYTLAMASNLPLTILLFWLLVDQLAWPMAVAAPVATVVMLAVNFFASRWAIVPRRQHGATT